MALSVAGVSLPIFFIALVLMQFLGVTLQWFPFMGRGGPLWTLDGLRHIVIPALSLGLIFVGPVARMTRSSVLEVLRRRQAAGEQDSLQALGVRRQVAGGAEAAEGLPQQ